MRDPAAPGTRLADTHNYKEGSFAKSVAAAFGYAGAWRIPLPLVLIIFPMILPLISLLAVLVSLIIFVQAQPNGKTVACPRLVLGLMVDQMRWDFLYRFYDRCGDGSRTGTTHGSCYPYDAHIPLLWMGWGVKTGHSHREIYMSDITPTLAALPHTNAIWLHRQGH
ncbi:MAG: hypothetical protein FJX89_03045 [Bacteroidetes bacterium]|nr:hypothetical protein [Bacteroidota bacterium]